MKDGFVDYDEYIVESETHKLKRVEMWKVESAPQRQQTDNPWQRLGYKNGIKYIHKK